jgi:hypothetical protein
MATTDGLSIGKLLTIDACSEHTYSTITLHRLSRSHLPYAVLCRLLFAKVLYSAEQGRGVCCATIPLRRPALSAPRPTPEQIEGYFRTTPLPVGGPRARNPIYRRSRLFIVHRLCSLLAVRRTRNPLVSPSTTNGEKPSTSSVPSPRLAPVTSGQGADWTPRASNGRTANDVAIHCVGRVSNLLRAAQAQARRHTPHMLCLRR